MRKKLKMPVLVIIGLMISLFIVLPMLVHSQGRDRNTKIVTHHSEETYFERISPRVKDLSKAYGVQPSIVMGQMAISSDFNQTLLSQDYHNVLALDAKTGQDFVDLQTDGGKVRYAVYPKWDDSVLDYLERLRIGETWGKDLYEMMATTKDYKKVAKAIQQHQFPKQSDYADKLIKLIEKYDLTRYDK
ncbi:glucosaminidase domain-containing protein [Streptococcus fryi]